VQIQASGFRLLIAKREAAPIRSEGRLGKGAAAVAALQL